MRRLVVILSLIVFGVVNANAADAVVIDGKTYVAQVTEDKPDTVVIGGKVYIAQTQDVPKEVLDADLLTHDNLDNCSGTEDFEVLESLLAVLLIIGFILIAVGIGKMPRPNGGGYFAKLEERKERRAAILVGAIGVAMVVVVFLVILLN